MTKSMQNFGLSEKEVIRKDSDFYLTIPQIAEALGTSRQNIHQIINRNIDEFEHDNVNLKLTQPILSTYSVHLICMLSRTKKAKAFRRLYVEMIEAIRKREFVHISELEKLKEKFAMQQEYAAVLAKIPARKLARYKKFRDMKLSRNEACKALDLSYKTMWKADKILGYYIPNPKGTKLLEKYRQQQRLKKLNENTLFTAEA